MTFGQIYLSKPSHYNDDSIGVHLMPNDARLRNLTYNVQLHADVKLDRKSATGIVHETTCKPIIGKIPMMVRSRYCTLSQMSDLDLQYIHKCPLDPGGYSIVNGTERLLITQETQVPNTILVLRSKHTYSLKQ